MMGDPGDRRARRVSRELPPQRQDREPIELAAAPVPITTGPGHGAGLVTTGACRCARVGPQPSNGSRPRLPPRRFRRVDGGPGAYTARAGRLARGPGTQAAVEGIEATCQADRLQLGLEGHGASERRSLPRRRRQAATIRRTEPVRFRRDAAASLAEPRTRPCCEWIVRADTEKYLRHRANLPGSGRGAGVRAAAQNHGSNR